MVKGSHSRRAQGHLKGLDFLYLEITPGCNLHCQHCYTESSPSVKNPRIVDWEKVLQEAYRLGCRRVQFIGGEPTYNLELMDHISTAYKLRYEFIEVYTNLTLMSAKLADQFRKYRVHLATSFYSARRETHEEITGVKGSFDKTVEGIRYVLSKKIPLRVGLTSMEANKHEINDAVEFLVGLGIGSNEIGIDHTRPVGRGLGLAKCQNLEETLCGHCWEGKLTVSWNGTCYPCVFARQVVVGNLACGNLEEIVRSEQLRQFRQRIFNHSSAGMKTAADDLFSRVLAIFSEGDRWRAHAHRKH